MTSLDEFKVALEQLVGKVRRVETDLRHLSPGRAGRGKPEETTKDLLIVPFLNALGFDEDHRTPEASMRRAGIGQLVWVDFMLKKHPDDRKGLALLEAKSLLEFDLWQKYQKQIRGYLHDYQLSLRTEDPVRWIVLTNFRELYILNIADYEPFFKLTCGDYVENASLLYRLLNREQLSHDQITSVYYEKRHVPLGKSFLNDLKLWRLLLANGLKQSQSELTLEQAKTLSQQILNRIIFIRVLETYGLHPYYSLVREYESWQREVRNADSFPFFDERLMTTFKDIELDLNTELFKNALIEEICASLTTILGHTVTQITIPNKYIRPLVDPDVYWPDRDQEIRELIGDQVGQQRFALSTPYNYDFHTLTQDIIGQVYEQFLAHSLKQEGNHILIRTDQTLRQREGAYYTPSYVVRYLVEGTLGHLGMQILAEARNYLQQKRYNEAQAAINRLKTIKVLDLACGSGSFLIAAYDAFVTVYRLWNELLEGVMAKDFRNDWIRFIESGLEKETNPGDSVLRHNIFGIDRDAQAIGEARLNMWLLLLRTQPNDYMRVSDEPPKRRLLDLSNSFVVADSLDMSFDIDALLGTDDQIRIILGNPPWGATITSDAASLDRLRLAKGQFDSYDLFIERATQILRPGDLFGYIVPDSLLQLPQHTPLRELILSNYHIDSVVKLGEGIFEDVFRAAVAFVFTRCAAIMDDHQLRSRIIVKAERNQLLKTSRSNTIQELLDRDGLSITQARFNRNREKAFDIFASDEDTNIVQAIDRDSMDWSTVTITSRGVELSKSGNVMACPHCGIWRPIPQKQKNGTYQAVKCANPTCRQTLHYEDCPKATIISPERTSIHTLAIIVGEGVNRYQTAEARFIDTSKVRAFPHCPNPNVHNAHKRCSFCDFAAPPFVPGEIRRCPQCGQTYTEQDVQEWSYLGINYKSPALYQGEKLLVRKTGRGIYATIDRTGAYTNQVVYIFKLRTPLPEEYVPLRLSYILGVLNSRMMLYRYYKALGDIEWKSFPYMTQKTIMQLPIRRIDFSDTRQAYFHNRIADNVDAIIASNRPSTPKADAEIEQLVRDLYGVNTPLANARIDAELERISQFGSLLGSSSEDGENEE
jgi:type I restriction-modification system DNA methylase subunit/predicted RNA-binding Zn-ribbon protein involved in translation (DUF1610 family)